MNDDDYISIPATFWDPFCADESEIAGKHEAGGGIVTTLKDGRQTYQRWADGTFAVRQPDGEVTEYHGIMFNRADLERHFPAPTVQ